MIPANPVRGEAQLMVGGAAMVLRPSFAALVAVEEELGSLFALVERAGDGMLTLNEMAGLFWHCLPPETRPAREAVGEAVMAMGVAKAVKPLRVLLGQILQGGG